MSVDRMPLVEEDEDQEELEELEVVARTAVARMREAEQAMTRHLEAMQHEASRRYELTVAQAELDAQLIRLHARRDANVGDRRIGEMTELVSDFADVVEGLRPGL
jgi:hypothetical protein